MRLTERDKINLLYALRQDIRVEPLFVAETGSHAWGTSTPESDHDFTVIAQDVHYDIFSYPRDSFTAKIKLETTECDVRIFSPVKFLRKLQKSVLVGYEAVFSPLVYHGNDSTRELLKSVAEHCFDPREMYRSVIGGLKSVNAEDPGKRRRQQFRYMFTALQLRDMLEHGRLPKVCVKEYILTDIRADNFYPWIARLYDWATSIELSEKEQAFAEMTLQGLYDFDYPSVRQFKLTEHRDFLNEKFAKLVEVNNL